MNPTLSWIVERWSASLLLAYVFFLLVLCCVVCCGLTQRLPMLYSGCEWSSRDIIRAMDSGCEWSSRDIIRAMDSGCEWSPLGASPYWSFYRLFGGGHEAVPSERLTAARLDRGQIVGAWCSSFLSFTISLFA
jgi:hypothetical protein